MTMIRQNGLSKAGETILAGCATVACRVRHAADDVRGIASVEFVILAPMLLFMAIGIIDLGNGVYSEMQVQNAAEAGAQYAIAHGFNSSAIITAVTSATGNPGVTVSSGPSQYCGCPTSTGITTTTCGSTCSVGGTTATFVTVSARATYTPIIAYPGIPSSFIFTYPATVRIK